MWAAAASLSALTPPLKAVWNGTFPSNSLSQTLNKTRALEMLRRLIQHTCLHKTVGDSAVPICFFASQALNKARALEMLKAKLVVVAQEQQLQEIAQIRGDLVKAGECR